MAASTTQQEATTKKAPISEVITTLVAPILKHSTLNSRYHSIVIPVELEPTRTKKGPTGLVAAALESCEKV